MNNIAKWTSTLAEEREKKEQMIFESLVNDSKKLTQYLFGKQKGNEDDVNKKDSGITSKSKAKAKKGNSPDPMSNEADTYCEERIDFLENFYSNSVWMKIMKDDSLDYLPATELAMKLREGILPEM